VAWDVFGWDFQSNLFGILYADWDGWYNEQQGTATTVMGRVGHPELNPRVIWTTLNHALRLNLPFVADPPLSEESELASNYIPYIYRSSWETLKDEIILPGQERPRALLYFLLRHAALTEYARAATDARIVFGLMFDDDRVEPELISVVPGTETRNTTWKNFEDPIDSLTGAKPLGDFLLDPNNPSPYADPIKSYRNSLRTLEKLPSAELDRLMAETLDVCSHRLDAWITSLASKRLKEMRRKRPAGLHLGAYGWVENLYPNPAGPQVTLPGGDIATVQGNSEGYIHAPSMTHAAAAAVLRNAHRSRPPDQEERYAIDLSSARVRAALHLLDSVRQGQPLGAVLGYQFERGLHENHRPLELDKYIEPFRRLFPFPPIDPPQPGEPIEPAEAIAARDVVDGYRLRKAWNENQNLFNALDVPVSGPDRDALEAELRRLDETVDGVADLLTAESIYQLMLGNTAGAAASLETMAAGVQPPDPQIARAQRSGTALTHRVGVVLGGDRIEPSVWKDLPGTPRSLAELYLNGWAGALLGNPENVWCRVRYPNPMLADPDSVDLDDCADRAKCEEEKVTLAQLQLQPLDLLALSLDVNRTPLDSELDRRVIYFGVGPNVTRVKILYTPPEPDDRLFPDWDTKVIRTFPEILEMAQAINAVIGGARPLRPADLLHPPDASKAEGAELLVMEARDRVVAARTELISAISSLSAPETKNAPELREALIKAAALGVAGAFPATRHGDSEELRKPLRAQAMSVRTELERRAMQADEEIPPADQPLTGARKIERLTKAMQAIFGDKFVFLPRFIPVNLEELTLGLNVVYPAPDASMAERRNAIRKWLQKISPVRPALGRWRKLFLYAEALGDYALLEEAAERFSVAQLPAAAGEYWVALEFPLDEMGKKKRPPSGRLSIVLHQPVAPAAGAAWAGLLLDEWNEMIPSESESTGIAFHYDDPGAEAAQAVLLAVPPINAAAWGLASLTSALRETLELAKLRAVGGPPAELSQILPAIYLSSNAANDAISTSLNSMKMTNTRINRTNTA
jgi:hypothetical protein